MPDLIKGDRVLKVASFKPNTKCRLQFYRKL